MLRSVTFFSSIYRLSYHLCGFVPVTSKDILIRARKISCKSSDIDGHSTVMSVGSVREEWLRKLIHANIPEATESVDHILTHLLQFKNVEELKKNQRQVLTPQICDMVEEKMTLRLKRMPVQYIIEEWDFFGMTLKMSPPVFIPRPETEDLVSIVSTELFSNSIGNQPTGVSFLEIGCGTGAISLALLNTHLMLNATAIDANTTAAALAQQNANLLRLNNRISISCRKLLMNGTITGIPTVEWNRKFNFLVSNPPYIPTNEIATLDAEVQKFESHLALDGGPDGTDLIEILIRHGPKWLKRSGRIFLEIDPRQVRKIEDIAKTTQLYENQVIVKKDCFGVDRFVILHCK